MLVTCEHCVLSGRGLCIGLITLLEKSYRISCECDREVLIVRRPWSTRGCCDMENKSTRQTKTTN